MRAASARVCVTSGSPERRSPRSNRSRSNAMVFSPTTEVLEPPFTEGAAIRLLADAASNSSNAVKSVATAQTNRPVSYTHLRAHETVLDLVCRLLLEKKKKTQKYIISHS